MDALASLASEEDQLATLVGSVSGLIDEKTAQLAALGVFARYQRVFDRYVAMFGDASTRLEALKRAQFLAWCDLSEPHCFSGVRLKQDGEHLARVGTAVDALIADDACDDELGWMLPYYYHMTDYAFPGLNSQPRLAELLRQAEPERYRAVPIAPDQFRGRGGMGAYWMFVFSSSAIAVRPRR